VAEESGLEALEPWLEAIQNRLKPGERMKLARKIGQILRARNAKRIAANTQPDGSKMEPRKPRKRGGKQRRGRMFKKTARGLRVRPFQDRVELDFKRPVSGAAKVHHFGLEDKVEHTPTAPRVRYPSRKLLGVPPEDREAIMDAALDWLAKN
jgi:phage virion morphogenesis protein